MTPLPANAGDPEAVETLREPVLRTAFMIDELSDGIVAGAVTPGNPVTPVQVPTGNATTGPGFGEGLEEGAPVAVDPALPAPVDVPVGGDEGAPPAEADGGEPADGDVAVVDPDVVADPDVVVAPDVVVLAGGVVGVDADGVASVSTLYAVELAASVIQDGGMKRNGWGTLAGDVAAGVPSEVLELLDVAVGGGGAGDGVVGLAELELGLAGAVATSGGFEGADVVPEMTAGADSPPAVAMLATIPRTTEPLAGAAVADATNAWASGVEETWVTSWIPVSTGVPAMLVAVLETAEELADAAPDATAWVPAVRAEWLAPAKTRRSAARSGAVRKSGTAAHAPLTALLPRSVSWRAARARFTRALAFTSEMPSAPATSPYERPSTRRSLKARRCDSGSSSMASLTAASATGSDDVSSMS